MARTISATGHIVWNENQVRILLSGPEGEVSTEVRRRATAVQKRAQRAAPMRTGQLRHSIHVNTRYPSTGAVADIYADAPHSIVVEFGRGEVRSRGGKHRLYWKGDDGDVFTKSARAVAGVHYMERALDGFDD